MGYVDFKNSLDISCFENSVKPDYSLTFYLQNFNILAINYSTRTLKFLFKRSLIFNVSPGLYLDLYVLGDDALISWGSFMQTKYLCVLIHI